MTLRRQKTIKATVSALDRALDQRDVLLAKLVRNEAKIARLRKRATRAQKAYVAQGDASVAAGVAPSPFRTDRMIADGDFNDSIP